MSCDHVIGSYAGHPVRLSAWFLTVGAHAAVVHFFRTTTLQVPHPGFVVPHGHCIDCGVELNLGAAKASISEAITVAVDAALGTDISPPQKSELTRESYLRWLLEPTLAAGTSWR